MKFIHLGTKPTTLEAKIICWLNYFKPQPMRLNLSTLLFALLLFCAAQAQPTVYRYQEDLLELNPTAAEIDTAYEKFKRSNPGVKNLGEDQAKMFFLNMASSRLSHVVALQWKDSLLLFRRFLEAIPGNDDPLTRISLFDGKKWFSITSENELLPMPTKWLNVLQAGQDTSVANFKAQPFHVQNDAFKVWLADDLPKHLSAFSNMDLPKGTVAYSITKLQAQLNGRLHSAKQEAAYASSDLWILVEQLRKLESD